MSRRAGPPRSGDATGELTQAADNITATIRLDLSEAAS